MLVAVVLGVLVLALAAAGGVLLMRLLRAELSAQRAETREELAARSSEISRRLEGLDGRLLSTQQSTGQTATQIVDRLGELGRTSAQMLQRANDLARLEQALRPPKARGGVGELLLANVLRDSLPADAYELQHTFRSGERVDAVVRADKLVPIDAKFPLENFERVVNAGDDAPAPDGAAEPRATTERARRAPPLPARASARRAPGRSAARARAGDRAGGTARAGRPTA